MTINGLSTVIECYKYVEKSKFKGLRVAVDFLIYWYKAHLHACHDEVGSLPLILIQEKKYSEQKILDSGINYFLKFLCDLLKEGILPVVIFDGQPFDLKAKYAAVARKKAKERAKERMQEMKEKDFSKFSVAEHKSYRSVVCQTIGFDRCKVFTKVKSLLTRVGLPHLQCVTEAEHLAVALCKENYCYAAYTSDSDTTALQCPFTISSEGDENGPDSPFFKTLLYSNVKKQFNFTCEQLTDLCILASCDYNKRVAMMSTTGKAKSIGIKTALKLMQQYGSLESIIENETIVEPECLEIETCRTIFKSYSVQELCPSFSKDQLLFKPNQEPIDTESTVLNQRIETIQMLSENLPPVFYFYSFW